MTRRSLLAAAFAPCPVLHEVRIDFEHFPEQARTIAGELGLTDWTAYGAKQSVTLSKRIDEGSAEHITYYVLQSRRFTKRLPIDPVKLAATKPASLTEAASQRFQDFTTQAVSDERHRIIHDLFGRLNWSPEACFVHTMRFLAERAGSQRDERDKLYQRRGLSADTTPEQTQVIERGLSHLKQRPERTLLIGPGLDLTRREAFSDDIPLRAYQVERLLKATTDLECADVRPEVLEFLKTQKVCPRRRDISAWCVEGQYQTAIATNVLVYFDDQALFAAMSGIARSLKSGGHLIHNDVRFAAKIFGEVMGMPVVHFEAVSLGRRQGVELMDRVVIHRKQ